MPEASEKSCFAMMVIIKFYDPFSRNKHWHLKSNKSCHIAFK